MDNKDIRVKRRKKENNDLDYERGMKGFGCSIILFIALFIIGFKDIVSANSIEEFIYEFGLYIILFIPFFVYNLFEYIFYKKNKTIRDRGVKVEGVICDIGCRVKGYKNHKRVMYNVTVEYIDPFSGKLSKYKTPLLNFDPFKDLGSKKCGVYVYNGKVSVSDFVVKEGAEMIFFMEDYPDLRTDRVEWKYVFSHITDFLFPIVIAGIIVGLFMLFGYI